MKPPVSAVAPPHSSPVPSVDFTERDTESNRGKAARGDHDTQDQQQHSHRPTPRPTRHAGKARCPHVISRQPTTSTKRLLWLLNTFDPISTPSAITIVAVCLTTWNLLNVQLNAALQPKRAFFGYPTKNGTPCIAPGGSPT